MSVKSRLVVHITAADVGQRVSVRSRVPDHDAHASMTDTVGRLLSWDDGVLRVERRDGTVATLAESDLLAGKVIGDPPQRSRGGYADR